MPIPVPVYAQITDLEARVPADELVQLTDDEGAGTLNVARLATALTQADNVIDGYVGAYYQRLDTVAPIPPLLTDIACDIARFRLYRRSTAPEGVAASEKAAVAKLRDIAKGVIKLDRGFETLPARDGMILVESSQRLFSRDTMRGY